MLYVTHPASDPKSQPLSDMTAGYNGGAGNSQLYLGSADISGGVRF